MSALRRALLVAELGTKVCHREPGDPFDVLEPVALLHQANCIFSEQPSRGEDMLRTLTGYRLRVERFLGSTVVTEPSQPAHR